ncbi:MAG: GTPase domain-containing protein [Acidimicrobiia bacterium]|nr:GTPase domain-containing protein [Acidimicrobiia bacterium]
MAVTDPALEQDLEGIADALEAASFRLPFDDRSGRDRARGEMATGIRQFLLPRVTDIDGPVVGLLTGPTGTGKSTLLNSLAERKLSEVSAIRGGTSDLVVWAHRRHGGRYWQEFVAKVEQHVGPSAEIILGEEPLLDHLTLIDAPPLGGVEGTELLALADLSVFVTSATRYADFATWDLLEVVRSRGIPVLFVINRVPRDAASSRAVVDDFATKLADAGFLPEPDPALLFVVFEHRIDGTSDGLPPGSVSGLRRELSELGNPAFREQLAATAARSLFADLGQRGMQVAVLAREEATRGRELLAMAERSYNARLAAIGSDLERGKYAHLAENWDPGRLAGMLARHIRIGAQDSAAAWSEHSVGRRLIQGPGDALWRSSPEATPDALAAIEAWGDQLQWLAADRSKRRRMFKSVRKRVGRVLRTSALAGADALMPDDLVKRYGAQGATGVVRAARSSLLDALGEAFQADASRFRAAVGPIERLEILAGLLEEKAAVFDEGSR